MKHVPINVLKEFDIKIRFDCYCNPDIYVKDNIPDYQFDIDLLFKNVINIDFDFKGKLISFHTKYYTELEGLDFIKILKNIVENDEFKFDLFINYKIFQDCRFKKHPMVISDFNNENNDNSLKFDLLFDTYTEYDMPTLIKWSESKHFEKRFVQQLMISSLKH